MNKLYALLLTLVTLSVGVFAVLPLWLLRPFAPQTAGGLALAYALERWGPLATPVLLVLGGALFALLWRGRARWPLRAPMLLAVVLLAAFTWLSRADVMQRFFAPLAETGFVRAAEAEHVAAEEMVLGVAIGAAAKAYPVGILAYHHVVNDELAGVPLAVTY